MAVWPVSSCGTGNRPDKLSEGVNDGEKLIELLGIQKFRNSYIQRVIDSSAPVYIVTIDSRRPGIFISYARLKALQSLSVRRWVSHGAEMDPGRMSLPIRLADFTGDITSTAVILLHDLAGEYGNNPNMFTTRPWGGTVKLKPQSLKRKILTSLAIKAAAKLLGG